MSDDTKTTDTYEVSHDPVSDVFTGGEGVEGPRTSTSETHDGQTDTYKVEHDIVSDLFTGGEGVKGDRISTTEERKD
jgi:hypothetical protein